MTTQGVGTTPIRFGERRGAPDLGSGGTSVGNQQHTGPSGKVLAPTDPQLYRKRGRREGLGNKIPQNAWSYRAPGREHNKSHCYIQL